MSGGIKKERPNLCQVSTNPKTKKLSDNHKEKTNVF